MPLKSRITGTGSYAPEKVLDNNDLEKMVDTSDEWITERTGIKERRIIGKGQTLTGFDEVAAIRAALEAACKDAGVAEDDIIRVGGTGSGKASIEGSDSVNDIKAMTKAARYYFPNAV